jgi:hypothetical protein
MALLLIIPSWLLLLALIVGLCRAAHLGDRQPQQGSGSPSAYRGGGAGDAPAWPRATLGARAPGRAPEREQELEPQESRTAVSLIGAAIP